MRITFQANPDSFVDSRNTQCIKGYQGSKFALIYDGIINRKKVYWHEGNLFRKKIIILNRPGMKIILTKAYEGNRDRALEQNRAQIRRMMTAFHT